MPENGECAKHLDIDFLDEATSKQISKRNAAKDICKGCAVQPQCLQYALDENIQFGIWGGFTKAERARLPMNLVATLMSEYVVSDTQLLGVEQEIHTLVCSDGRPKLPLIHVPHNLFV